MATSVTLQQIRANLALPAQNGNANEYLTTNGGALGWVNPWAKYTVDFSDLNIADTTVDVEIAALPTKALIDSLVFRWDQFAAPGAALIIATPIINGSIPNVDVDLLTVCPTGGQLRLSNNFPTNATNFTGPVTLALRFTSDVNLNTLTTGSIDFYVKTSSLP